MRWIGASVFAGAMACLLSACAQTGALPSWRDGASRDAIVGFVERVTDEDSGEYVPPRDRIAVFDNDGCLWAEQPVYFQFVFAVDRVRALAPSHPEWRDSAALRAAIDADFKALAATGEEGLAEVIGASHGGLAPEEFAGVVHAWLEAARHPTTGLEYDDMTYAPMVELLGYLRDNGFRTYVVSGGGVEFMRVFAEDAYGIPPEQVIGSRGGLTYEEGRGLVRSGEITFIDDKAGKPVGIWERLGARPIAAFGNSDGDFAMLDWVTSGDGPRLGVLIHHTDAEREWAYDRESHIGTLERGLDDGPGRGWVIVDMAKDWERVFTGDDDDDDHGADDDDDD